MIRSKNRTVIVSTFAILTLSLAVTALAHGFGRGGRGDQGDHGGPGGPGIEIGHFSQLVDQLIHPCRSNCLNASRSCDMTADAAAVTCAQSTCNTSIQTATTACATDRSSQACKDALTALRTCIQPCVDAQSTAIMSCRTTLLSCLSTCPGAVGTPTPTPAQ